MTTLTTNGGTLMQASHQWASRPADERFTSLIDMDTHFDHVRARSAAKVVSSRRLEAQPTSDNKGLVIVGPNGVPVAPTNWAFKQVSQLAGAPGGYLAKLPSPIAADCLNYGLQIARDVEDVGVLLHKPDNGAAMLRAATGPNYGRIWNSQITGALVKNFGDGTSGDWKVPGEFGKDVIVTKANTTLFAGDRDMFVFLADEKNRVGIPNRRNGLVGTAARGFFVWNSEVGDSVFGFATFLFDYACCNRIVWGVQGHQEIRIRHTTKAPDRFLDELRPALLSYANGSSKGITDTIVAAQKARIDGSDGKLDEFLKTRFGANRVASIKAAHILEEGRPIETVWDAVTGATAFAKGIDWQDDRVKLERQAGELLKGLSV